VATASENRLNIRRA
jgi:DNA-binding transcriptional LysR family regulator